MTCKSFQKKISSKLLKSCWTLAFYCFLIVEALFQKKSFYQSSKQEIKIVTQAAGEEGK